MQIVSYGDNLHETSNPILRKKEEKYQLNFARELNVKNSEDQILKAIFSYFSHKIGLTIHANYQLNFARELNVKNVPKIVRNYRTKILQIISNAIIVV